MKFIRTLLASAALSMSTLASATVVLPGSEQSLQSVIEGLYQSPTCPTCSPVSQAPNVNLDQYWYDQLWSIEASGASVATLIIEIAGLANVNRFGVYDAADPSRRLELFNGAATSGASVAFGIDDTGSVYRNFVDTGLNFGGNLFGYYLETPTAIFYSQSGLNAAGSDQMVAVRGDGVDKIKLPTKAAGIWGSSSFILAWEDTLYGSSDKDFNDLVVYVESVTGVSAPGTLASLAIALLGAGFFARRRQQ